MKCEEHFYFWKILILELDEEIKINPMILEDLWSNVWQMSENTDLKHLRHWQWISNSF